MHGWGSTEQRFASHRPVPAAARLPSTLTSYSAPSSAFKPLSPALFSITAGQTKLKPVVWLPVCLTPCGWEGVMSLRRLGQSCPAGPGPAALPRPLLPESIPALPRCPLRQENLQCSSCRPLLGPGMLSSAPFPLGTVACVGISVQRCHGCT